MSRQHARRGRYTPPKSKEQGFASPSTESESQAFWSDYRQADAALRRRCDLLMPSEPPTSSEWLDADLMGMDGQYASDEALVAYWTTHRAAAELDAMELPDLRFVTDHLSAGRDPAFEFVREWNETDED